MSICGHSTGRWVGKCIACDNWNTVIEEIVVRTEAKSTSIPISIKALSNDEIVIPDRLLTGIEELDRVFGGGIVKGTNILIGGEPGIENSTLLLKIAASGCTTFLFRVSLMCPAKNLWNK